MCDGAYLHRIFYSSFIYEADRTVLTFRNISFDLHIFIFISMNVLNRLVGRMRLERENEIKSGGRD
jgi:hypothetical protein